MSNYPYQPHNSQQRDLDDVFRITGGQIVHLRVDWAKRLGSIHTAIVLQQLIFRGRLHADAEGWFYVTADVMEDETAVGEKGYAAARTKLIKEGILETERRGLPRRLWLRFNLEHLLDWIDETPSVRDRIQSRQLSEQASTNGGTRVEASRTQSRQRAEQLNETLNKTGNEVNAPIPENLPMWKRFDPVTDRDLIMRRQWPRPEVPSPVEAPAETVMAWHQLQQEWDKKNDPSGRLR